MESHHKAWLIGTCFAFLVTVILVALGMKIQADLDAKYIASGYTRATLLGRQAIVWVKP